MAHVFKYGNVTHVCTVVIGLLLHMYLDMVLLLHIHLDIALLLHMCVVVVLLLHM